MRILHVALSFAQGGKRIAIASLIEGLRDLGVASDLCLLDELECPQEDVAALGVGMEVLSRRSLFDLQALARLRRFCQRSGTDVIHTHDAASQATACLARLGMRRLPLLMTFHRSLGFESATRSDRIRNALACWRSSAVITGSRERREHFLAENFVSPDKVVRIPFGTDLSRFYPDPESRAAVREELGVGPETTVLGTIGHFGPEKGVDVAIRAYQSLLTRSLPGQSALVIFGEGPRRSELEELSRLGNDSRGRIQFLGFRNDVHRCMRGMDILLHTPRLEAFGLVIIEAMATGLPVVASRVGGIPDLVRDKVTGVLAESENPQSFAAVLERLLPDQALRVSMGQEARRIALAEYGRELYARRHQQLYECVLAERSPQLPDLCAAVAASREAGGEEA